ncbi:uncharacterized protein LOC117646360 [Thrips palmi]|uniref:Uncharacterized protein LOC117646360 n=1 Tax=Thrips palmi TaxID=161013 RepID=A0A6P8Z0J5_THRPL|nr:uncharacterized protein LOC117646360 [Thrips palmi]
MAAKFMNFGSVLLNGGQIYEFWGELVSEANERGSGAEIRSVEQLARSNLTILLGNPTHAQFVPVQGWGLADKVQYTEPLGMTQADVLDRVGVARDAATFMMLGSQGSQPPMLADRTRVRLFRLPIEESVTDYIVMRGWPYEGTFRRFLGRWRAAGLFEKFEQTGPANPTPDRNVLPSSFEPLTLAHAWPMLRILLEGCQWVQLRRIENSTTNPIVKLEYGPSTFLLSCSDKAYPKACYLDVVGGPSTGGKTPGS